jgi:alanine dehydrogenase
VEIRRGANVINGKITYKGVSDAFSLDYTDIDSLL